MLGMFAGLLGVATRCIVDAARYGTPKKMSKRDIQKMMQKSIENEQKMNEVIARHRMGLQEIEYVQMDGSVH